VGVFDELGGEYEEVVFFHDPPTGLRAIIAIHSTTLGPALGGTRFYPFGSDEDALRDVLRLARGMTYKAAAAGLDLGGGKAVIIGDPKRIKSEELLRAYGRFLETLGGRYITAEDIGTDRDDMVLVRRETRYVTGVSPELGGSGDPSPVTAYGVYLGLKACVEEAWQEHSLEGRRIAGGGGGWPPAAGDEALPLRPLLEVERLQRPEHAEESARDHPRIIGLLPRQLETHGRGHEEVVC
jgi:glutamate dehydrogenase/leucine dehydrogenase